MRQPNRVLTSRAEAVDVARDLAPRLRERALETERQRRTHDDSIRELLRSGLFGLLVPKRFGGSELGMAAMFEAAVEMSQGCGSTGWVFGVISGHMWLTALFPEQTQGEVFEDPDSLVSIVIRFGQSTNPSRVDGGYLWRDGSGRFCSGIDHANWVALGGAVEGPDGRSEQRYFMVPRADVEIVDDWFTTGLRGTGSKSIRIKEAFIPEHRSVRLDGLNNGTSPGAQLHPNPLYRLTMGAAMPMGLAAPSIGIAREALDTVAATQGQRLERVSPEQLGESSAMFARLAQAAGNIDAAFNLLMNDCERLDALEAPEGWTAFDWSRIGFHRAYSARLCRDVVNSLFDASGGSGIYETTTIQRLWRDGNAACAHGGFHWDTAAPGFGRQLLGLPPSRFARAGRARVPEPAAR